MTEIDPVQNPRKVPYVGGEPTPGTIVEMIYQPEGPETVFAISSGSAETRYARTLPIGKNVVLVPYSPTNNLLRNKIVLFPSEAAEYESEAKLIDEIREFVHRYVDVSPLFETITCYYIFLTWVYESFNELPYLRIRGDFGSGKTRFLLIVGSLVFRPIFASGASTISPLFRMLDSFRGTLLIDEGDFRFTDEKAELVKILNNGNARGFPVLRSEQAGSGKEFNPVAYNVFGPKIVASRGHFQDRALESRFITEETGGKRLRSDIPINLPSSYEPEALALRNKLLMFRFRNLHTPRMFQESGWAGVEPRFRQIFSPLLSLIPNEPVRSELQKLAALYSAEMTVDRQGDLEAQVLRVIQELLSETPPSRLAIGDITRRLNQKFGDDYERKITERWIGSIVRKKLQLKAQRVHGVFVIPPTEDVRLKMLFDRYGLRDEGDIGDVAKGPA